MIKIEDIMFHNSGYMYSENVTKYEKYFIPPIIKVDFEAWLDVLNELKRLYTCKSILLTDEFLCDTRSDLNHLIKSVENKHYFSFSFIDSSINYEDSLKHTAENLLGLAVCCMLSRVYQTKDLRLFNIILKLKDALENVNYDNEISKVLEDGLRMCIWDVFQ